MKASDVWVLPKHELAKLLANGYAIDPQALVDGDYRGVSLGLPRLIEKATWKVFRKVFRQDETSGQVHGHNVRMHEPATLTPLEDGGEQTTPREKNGQPIIFGPYSVESLPADGSPFKCRAGLLINYCAKHPQLHPLSLVRDPVVALREGDARLLLGATYLAGVFSARTPSFFTLERER